LAPVEMTGFVLIRLSKRLDPSFEGRLWIVSMALEPVRKSPAAPRCFRSLFTIWVCAKSVKTFFVCKSLRDCGKGKRLERRGRRGNSLHTILCKFTEHSHSVHAATARLWQAFFSCTKETHHERTIALLAPQGRPTQAPDGCGCQRVCCDRSAYVGVAGVRTSPSPHSLRG